MRFFQNKYVLLGILSALIFIQNCKYDVTGPQWDKKISDPPVPLITSVDPAVAVPGVNFITIHGSNLAGVPVNSGVYFNTVSTEVISNTENTVVVRRPDIVSDSIEIKVLPELSFVSAKYNSPYNVQPVTEEYGKVRQGVAFDVVAVDAAENVYLIENVSGARNIFKISVNGDTTDIGRAALRTFGTAMGPDNRLYLLQNSQNSQVVNLQTSEISAWVRFTTPRIRFGDFDAAGYFYAGGPATQLVIVEPNPPLDAATGTRTGLYGSDQILSIKVHEGYVYIAVDLAAPDSLEPELAIWKHFINGDGTVGDRELVADFSSNAGLGSRVISNMQFSADGKLIVSTNNSDPLLIIDPASGEIDYFYKEILPSNVQHFAWGPGNSIYMIIRDTALDDVFPWKLFKVDMGITAAP